MKKVTLKEVAKKAKVSVTMASRVLGNYGYFGRQTEQNVLKSAKTLGYRTNNIARFLKKGQSKIIGVLLHDLKSSFWTEIYQGIAESAYTAGYQAILCDSAKDSAIEEKYINLLYQNSVIEGLILSPTTMSSKTIAGISKSGFPVVLIDHTLPGISLPAVTIDNTGGAEKAVNFLVELNHSDIVIVIGSEEEETDKSRIEGYKNILKQNHLPIKKKYILSCGYEKDLAYNSIQNLFTKEKKPPTAIFVTGELMALGVLGALNDLNLRIPQDVSVLTWNDFSWAGVYKPALTTIRQPVFSMGVLAFDTLVKQFDNINRSLEKHTLKPELVIRNSCKKIKNK